jgi:chromate transport protein ChrA
MIFTITQVYAGVIPAFMVFLLWTLPGATVMYGLSLGVQQMDEILPGPAYALLSGLNAATVGIVALSAMHLARRAVTDRLTRLLVLFGGCASMLYSALWYSPALLAFAALVTLTWDTGGGILGRNWRSMRNRRLGNPGMEAGFMDTTIPTDTLKASQSAESIRADRGPASAYTVSASAGTSQTAAQPFEDSPAHAIPAKTGLIIIGVFFITFTILMSLREGLHHSPLTFALFNSMFLAGTIVFGGGSVIIALLRDYVVQPGWVSPRDFLIGLAVIQALPGPNSNFGVYLGALVLAGPASTMSVPSIVGALLAFVGIFSPCLWLAVGFRSLWQSSRENRTVMSVLRGINATAVGFLFAAVYRLWRNGYLSVTHSRGGSLGQEPWWVVVAATTFTMVEWFSVPPPVAILSGGVAGLAWWCVVGQYIMTQPHGYTYLESVLSVMIPRT